MSIVKNLQASTIQSLTALYNQPFTEKDFQINATKPEFEGDYTVVLFSLVKSLKLSPEVIGNELGQHLVQNNPTLFSAFNIIKGFLNLTVADSYWLDVLQKNYNDICFGKKAMSGKKVMVEYSSPNTNKPLHLGHLRNNFLGWSVAEILKANGNDIVKTCIVNDRGIHICKSMIAWQLYANGATPQSTNTKGDHFVGEYYVKFNDELKIQSAKIFNNLSQNIFENYELDTTQIEKTKDSNSNINSFENMLLIASKSIDFNKIEKFGYRIQVLSESALDGNIKWSSVQKGFNDDEYKTLTEKEIESKKKELSLILKDVISIEAKLEKEVAIVKDTADNLTSIMKETQKMLLDWEAGKPDVIALWKEMNSWVYSGFDVTYKNIGSDFDKVYYESNTYLLGKKIVEQGLAKNVFVQEDDSSVWIDLTTDGLDKKIVQRKDGTSVYITQDIGLAQQKYEEYGIDQSIYVIGDEQNYHMKVLKLIAEKLQLPNAENIFHLSYGMVELTTGKMKSREGTVVDADDIVAEMEKVAQEKTEELGKVKDFETNELHQLYHTIGLGALKFFLLRVDPKKRMIFNPAESIDFHGFTGPFVQYTHARIKSILRKQTVGSGQLAVGDLATLEKKLMISLEQYGNVIEKAANEHNPSEIAIYVFEVAKIFNSFYAEHSITNAETEEKKQLRLQLASMTANVIKSGMALLGIDVPERM